MDCSLPGSSVHGIFQAIVLEWVAISFSRMYSIMLSTVTVLLFPFQCGFLFFLLLWWLLLGCPKLCWIKVKGGYPWLVPDLTENAFSLSPLSRMLAVGLSYMAFIMLSYTPSNPTFWSFYHKWYWILSKTFSASIETIIWFLFFNLLLWCITLIDLQIIKKSFHTN